MLVDTTSVIGVLSIPRITKIMLNRRLNSFDKAYLALMKSDTHLHFSRYLAKSTKMKKHLNEMDFYEHKGIYEGLIRMSVECDEKMIDLDKFERKLRLKVS